MPYYKYRNDGKPGRAVLLKFVGSKLYEAAELKIVSGKDQEIIRLESNIFGLDSVEILLSSDIGVKQEAVVSLTLQSNKGKLMQTIKLPLLRQWTVYVYPHSHVDHTLLN